MHKFREVHLICNAHLDPVWLWEWEEGAAEAISTFRTAAELCEQNDTFIFNHNEVVLYKWINEYEPSLFKRIQKLVKKGRWHIMGGWYLQPDCNMPSGESFVRQILLGKAYFRKHFGVEPKTAINFDPFGHSRGLVQILAKSGYDSYLFGRPTAYDKAFHLAGDDFIWEGFDGSQILAHRFEFPYNSNLGGAAGKLEKWISEHYEQDISAMLWGVGNHGGGASRIDLENLNELIRGNINCTIRHSTPEAYFKNINKKKDKLPCRSNDLNPWAVGCYTSQIRIKQKHRLLENELYSLEKMVSAAFVQGFMEYPHEQIHEATCDLMVSQFHDILPGSSIEPVEEAALRQIDHGLEIISRLKAKAFFSLASGQKKARDGEIPILVYNQHPFNVRQNVECEFNLPDFRRERKDFTCVDVINKDGQIISQVEHEQSLHPYEWRKRIVFDAELEPGMNRFDCRLRIVPRKPVTNLKVIHNKIVFKTKELHVEVNTRTGFIDRYRINGADFVGKNAFEPIVIADNNDAWGMMTNSFRKVIGRFKLMSKQAGCEFSGIRNHIDSVRIIEDGPVRSIVEAVLAYNNSFICLRYKLPKNGTEIEIEILVHWNEKDKMLKLSVPTVFRDCKYLGQVAYGVQQLPNNGDEAVAQKWVAVVSKKNDCAITCINDGVYGSDFSKDGLRLTLLISPAHTSHPDGKGGVFLPQDRHINRIDQGVRVFRFWFNGSKKVERLEKIDREALVKNEKPFALSFFPSGTGKKVKPLAILNDDVVQITAIKRAEANHDLIIRIFEPTGKNRETILLLPIINKQFHIKLTGFEIKTLKINLKNKVCSEVNLLEKSQKEIIR